MPPSLVESEWVPFNKARPFQPNNQFGRKNVRQPAAEECSVNRKPASLYLALCCFYNCCFPCKPAERLMGPVCGESFCCPWAFCTRIKMRRDKWLWFLNLVCCLVHTTFAVTTFMIGAGNDMNVGIYRVMPSWQNTGGRGYSYAVIEDFQVRIDTVTGLFFALSALFHGIWVVCGGCMWANYFLWRSINICLCYLRWIEYSLSASLMLVAIGMISGMREGYALLGVFMLCWCTMLCGMMTEMLSRPEPVCYDEEGRLIYNMEKWQYDPDPVPWEKFNFECWYKKFMSYCWRMTPHFIGWVPYISAWFIVLSNFLRQIYDLPADIRERIPVFVVPAITGTFVIFSCFSFVQMRYQWIAPCHYWRFAFAMPCYLYCFYSLSCSNHTVNRTEVWYCVLSLTAKLYLGGLLLFNVITVASFDEAISPTAANATATG